MSAYSVLARHYDALMAHVDYTGFVEGLEPLLNGAKCVLDLGCGTGTVAALLSERGYDVIGVDSSEDMLAIARNKTDKVLFLRQDMTALDLYGTVQAAVCTLDGLNYLTDEKALREALRRVALFLEPGGRFVFDMHAPGLLASRHGMSLVSRTEDVFCVWEYSWKAPVCRISLNIFEREGAYWRRSSERHAEREYSPGRVVELLKEVGFSRVSADVAGLNHFDLDPGVRVFFVCER